MNSLLVPAFLLLSLLMIWLLYKSTARATIKIVSIVSLLFISSATYFSFDSYKGWPISHEHTTEKMLLLSVSIFDETNEKSGSIFVTAIPCIGKAETCYSTNSTTYKYLPFNVFGFVPAKDNFPRFYEFPYNKDTKQFFEEARQRIANGEAVMMKSKSSRTSGEGGDNKEGEGEDSVKGAKANGQDNTENAFTSGAKDFFLDKFQTDGLFSKNPPT